MTIVECNTTVYGISRLGVASAKGAVASTVEAPSLQEPNLELIWWSGSADIAVWLLSRPVSSSIETQI